MCMRLLAVAALALTAHGCSCETSAPAVDAAVREDTNTTFRTCDDARVSGVDGARCEGSFFCSAGGAAMCECTTFYECVSWRLGVTRTCPCD